MVKQARVDIDVQVRNAQRISDLENSLNRTQKAAVTLGSAAKIAAAGIAALGVGQAIRSLVSVGQEVESLGLRFKFLFRSAEEGQKAFDVLTKYAAKVPFSLGEISKAAGSLAVVSADAEELGRILEATGNIAAVSGLDFQTAAAQIQRGFSGGSAAADVFREKGVLALLGFQQGVQSTAKQFRDTVFRTFGAGGDFGKATDEFSKTLAGTLSMLGDKLFKFQDVASKGFFAVLKRELGDLNTFFDENADKIDHYAKILGESLGEAVIVAGRVLKTLADNADLVKFALEALIVLGIANLFYNIAKAIQTATVAMLAFNVASKANVLLALASGLLALLTYLGLTAEKTDESSDNWKEHAGALEGVSTGADKATFAYDKLNREMGLCIISSDQLSHSLNTTGQVTKSAAATAKELQAALDAVRINYDNLLGADKSFVEQILILGETSHEKIIRLEEEKMAKINEMLARGAINKREHENLKTRIEAEGIRQRMALAEQQQKDEAERHRKNLELIKQGKFSEIKVEEMTQKQKQELIYNTGKGMLENMGTFNKKAFEAYKAVQIAEAVIASKASILGAYASGSKIGGPIVGAIFAAAAAAFTLAQVNAIRNQQYTGRRKGGIIASGQSYMVGEAGPEVITAGSNGYVTPNNMLGAGGEVIINFNVTATDAASFDQLLAQRRDTIVSLVNQALNERGRRSLTA